MNCPLCEHETKVIDSRPDSESVHRRRRCLNCGYRFNTIELDADIHKRERLKLSKAVQPLRFSVEYDPASGQLRLIGEETEK